jgi:hypothetical protein
LDRVLSQTGGGKMLTIFYSPEQRATIHETLRNLFVFHGQKITDDAITIFVNEIASWCHPIGKVIDGIKSLNAADLRKVILAEIKHTLPLPKNEQSDFCASIKCQHCNDSGIATLTKKTTNSGYAFRCVCPEGQRQSLAIPLWDGKFEMGDYQYHIKDKYFQIGNFAKLSD